MNLKIYARPRLVYANSETEIPLVSIIIPTYRRESMLKEALTSALLQDTKAPIEIIVVDNDPESAASILAKVPHQQSRHQLRYYVNSANIGMFGNWNQGLSLAKGRWLSFLHDDDWLAPQFVSDMLPLMQDGVEFAVCQVKAGNLGYEPGILPRRRDSDRVSLLTIDDLVYTNPSPAPGLLLSREKLIDIGGFDPDTYPSGDYLTYTRCARSVISVRLNRTLAYYRMSDSQTFKENTLQLMIEQSDRIKRELLSNAQGLSTITYVLSMAYWFRIAREHATDLSLLKFDWRLKIALAISRVQPLLRVAKGVRLLIKFLIRKEWKPSRS